MLRVKLFTDTPEDTQLWNNFVMEHPESTSDHLWCWKTILQKAFAYDESFYFGVLKDGELQGILPLYRIPRGISGATALTSIPFGNYGGICAKSEHAAEALLNTAMVFVYDVNASYLELRHRYPIEHESVQMASTHTHSRYFIKLSTPELHWKALGQNNRSKVQRAKKWGLTISESHDADNMYPIYSHTAHRQGVPCFPKIYFREILREFGENSKILMVNLEGKPIAYYLVLYFKDSMIAQFAGSYSDYYSYYPNELLFWTAIEEACALKFKEFDFCRSREGSGTAAFKRKLRFESAPLPYQYYLPGNALLPAHSPSNPKFQMAVNTWRKLPLELTQLAGPHLVRYFA